MKYLLIFIISLWCNNTLGQTISGIVTDKSNKRPIGNVIIAIGRLKTMTNTFGQFEFTAILPGDTLKINHFSYKPYAVPINKATEVLLINLEPSAISLNVVTIKADKSFKKDSVDNRMANQKQFNYIGPTVADAFKGGGQRQPGELFSINPIVLVQALTKKSSREYKFKQKLILDEQDDYVDRKFNEGNVARITGLKGDTLSMFLVNYRPNYRFAKKSTNYEMIVYIRQCLEKFKENGMKWEMLVTRTQ